MKALNDNEFVLLLNSRNDASKAVSVKQGEKNYKKWAVANADCILDALSAERKRSRLLADMLVAAGRRVNLPNADQGAREWLNFAAGGESR